MKYIQFLAVTGFLACLSVQAFASDPMVGGDIDENGCKASAGYSWSESKEECVRAWMEDEKQLGELDSNGCHAGSGYSWSESKEECVRPWEATTYPSFEEMIEAEPTCKMANDGCNSVGVLNGEKGMMTQMYCEDIYGEDGQEAWSCSDAKMEHERIGFLSTNDQNQYKVFQDRLGTETSQILEEAVAKYGDKVLERESYNMSSSIEVANMTLRVFEKAISDLSSKYPADSGMSTSDTQTYYILTVAKYEVEIMKHRWENSISTTTEVEEGPADFIPGAVYDSEVQECKENGGTMVEDGNGVYFCDMN